MYVRITYPREMAMLQRRPRQWKLRLKDRDEGEAWWPAIHEKLRASLEMLSSRCYSSLLPESESCQ